MANGLEPGQTYIVRDTVVREYVPIDREAYNEALARALNEGKPFNPRDFAIGEMETVQEGGTWRLFTARNPKGSRKSADVD